MNCAATRAAGAPAAAPKGKEDIFGALFGSKKKKEEEDKKAEEKKAKLKAEVDAVRLRRRLRVVA